MNKKELQNADLRFSKYFDVQAFGSSSGASKGRVFYPETLEDAFSSIHKELQTMLRILNKNAVGEDLPMPSLLKKAHQELKLGNATGYDLQANGLTLHYTIPLREHGVQYHLSSVIGSDKLKLDVRFSAQNENNRWDKIAHFMVALKVSGKFDIKEFDQNSRGVGFTFYLDGKDDFISLESILRKIELASTEIAQPRFGIPDISPGAALKVDNAQKRLKPIEDPRLIVEEFENDCGIGSMMESRLVMNILSVLVEKDPAYVETVLKKCWQTKKMFPYFSLILPKQLLKAGHSGGAIAAYALKLLNSRDSDINKSYSLQLMSAVAEASSKDLPITSSQIFKILADPKFNDYFDSYKHAFGVLEAIMQKGSDDKLENFVTNLTQLLTAEDKTISDNGLKALDLLAKYSDNYSIEFIEGITTKSHELKLPEAIKQLVEEKLALFLL